MASVSLWVARRMVSVSREAVTMVVVVVESIGLRKRAIDDLKSVKRVLMWAKSAARRASMRAVPLALEARIEARNFGADETGTGASETKLAGAEAVTAAPAAAGRSAAGMREAGRRMGATRHGLAKQEGRVLRVRRTRPTIERAIG
ncbi:hypothetical protein CAOG_009429 [Capsaspora owczarzaki ATCC 30864]|uniref:Uncharacterized protein n=1 Tax=Capsaspora owczarzaki (strain ATCC 30864) TaxID=595528 RepID=A0A0D2WKK3_CAPO3|nr:hypothetical protein CAOG_009429 [Capsaspora owczarzaki ATCC 30864]